MTGLFARLSLALREWRRVVLPLGLWLAITAVSGIAGPFGTYDALPGPARLAYWGGIAALSIGLSNAMALWARGMRPWQRVTVRIVFALVLAVAIILANWLVFPGGAGVPGYAVLTAIVLLVVLAVDAVTWLLRQAGTLEAAGRPVPAPHPAEAFLRRLPLERRGRVIRLEAQDHYLKVVTDRGEALILMRMADAWAELSSVAGLRVHRSHWVALDRILRHQKRAGRDFLVMADGAEIPIGRSFRGAVRDAGVF